MSARYISIKDYDMKQANGISVSLWFQGCPHCCKGCYNKQTWDMSEEAGQEFNENTIKYILTLLKDKNVNKNLSVLGGEPLLPRNLELLESLCIKAKEQNPNMEIWIWTGYEYEEVKHLSILKHIDYLVDGKFIEEKKELHRYKGSTNQRVIKLR